MLFQLPEVSRAIINAAIEAQVPRSPQWRRVEQEHLAKEPFCRFCGTTDHLEVHHIVPFHVDPAKELDERSEEHTSELQSQR